MTGKTGVMIEIEETTEDLLEETATRTAEKEKVAEAEATAREAGEEGQTTEAEEAHDETKTLERW